MYREFSMGRRHAAALLCAGLLFGLLSVLSPSRAGATVVPLSIEEMMAIADEVVAVRVTETESFAKSGKIYTTATFEVMDSFKGNLKGTGSMTYMGGKWRQLVMEVPAIPNMAEGEEAVLFLSDPLKQYPKGVQEKFMASDSPASRLQVVGGHQGKFVILEDEAGTSGKKGFVTNGVVARQYPDARRVSAEDKPGYEEFASALKKLAVAQASATKKGNRREIKGLPGQYAVPERSDDQVVRAFDPLPPMAYLSDAELKDLEKTTKARILEKQKALKESEEAKDK